MPNDKKDLANNVASGITEAAVDNVAAIDLVDTDSGIMPDDVKQIDDETNIVVNVSYEKKVKDALSNLEKGGDAIFSPENLQLYSPKFLQLLNNISDTEMKETSYLYSI